MTIFFPDVSKYTPVDIQNDTVAVIARATLSSSYADPYYLTCKQQAASKGTKFAAYHWLNHGNIQAQAKWAYQHVGNVPLMIDAEDVSGNTGYAGPITVDDLVSFAVAYRALGGICNLFYLPHWYWEGNMKSPSLIPCQNAGLHLVSSNYTAYSDNGPGWQPYGGMTPIIWQYTDALLYAGYECDFNAFKGTVDDLWALLNGGSVSGEADKAFSAPYSGNESWISAQSWMAKAVETPLNKANSKLDGLTTKLDSMTTASASGMTDADRVLLQAVIDSNNALKASVDALAHQLSSP